MGRQVLAVALAALAGIAFLGGCAQPRTPQDLQKYHSAAPEDLEWWQDARFGLFIHWGPVSIQGTEIGWSRGGERRGREGKGLVPVEVYDNLYKQFNPVKFNAREWVALAKAAGMKYLVFTTKHHDGFCMFDSQLTDYKITNSPFHRDVVAELANACHEGGLKLGFYYSPPDWHHPDYRTENHARYVKYMHGQIRELLTKYGKVDILWFDGLGGTKEDWDSERLFAMIRTLQPGIIINNRAGLPADHDTPEQTVGAFRIDRPWESCITIGEQWAYKPNDNIKSAAKIIQTLLQCAGGDGNLLFNVGPTPLGEIEPPQPERLREVGQWLEKYGHTVYGTRGGPFAGNPWGVSTRKGNTVYLHVFNWTKDTIRLAGVEPKILGCSALTGGEAEYKQTPDMIEIRLPAGHADNVDTIIGLTFDGPLPPAVLSKSLTLGKRATASGFCKGHATFAPERAFDGSLGSRWATDNGVKSAWIEVDLGEPTEFNQAIIMEHGHRVQEFELQVKEGDNWRTIKKGQKLSTMCVLEFETVRARHVRLNLPKTTDGPSLYEFQLFEQ